MHPRSRAPYADLSIYGWHSRRLFDTISFQDRLAFKPSIGVNGDRRAGIILDCTEAREVMVRITLYITIIQVDPLEQPFTVLIDLAFLTRDEVLVLLKVSFTGTIELGIFSIPEQKIIVRFRFPFIIPCLKANFLKESTTHSGGNYPNSRAMLQPDPRRRIIPFMYHQDTFPYSYCVVLHAGPFMKRCKELLNGSSKTEATFEWMEWSPNVASFIPLNGDNNTTFQCAFGSCILALGRPLVAIEGLTYQDRFLMLLDFNPIPIRRGCEERSEDDYYLRLLHRNTEWNMNTSLFSGAIPADLPCRVFMRRCGPYDKDDYLVLDANTIAWCQVRPFYYPIFIKALVCLPLLELQRTKDIFFSFLPSEGQEDTSMSDIAKTGRRMEELLRF
jgi:hypothetical protein